MWVCENLHQILRENKIEECGSKTLENRRIKKLLFSMFYQMPVRF